MRRFFILSVTVFLSGCENTGTQTGFQKSMQTVGRTTWKGTKAVGFGFGYVTEKIGQGIAFAGRGVASSGGALEKASAH